MNAKLADFFNFASMNRDELKYTLDGLVEALQYTVVRRRRPGQVSTTLLRQARYRNIIAPHIHNRLGTTPNDTPQRRAHRCNS